MKNMLKIVFEIFNLYYEANKYSVFAITDLKIVKASFKDPAFIDYFLKIKQTWENNLKV
jgi:hypothetical protein